MGSNLRYECATECATCCAVRACGETVSSGWWNTPHSANQFSAQGSFNSVNEREKEKIQCLVEKCDNNKHHHHDAAPSSGLLVHAMGCSVAKDARHDSTSSTPGRWSSLPPSPAPPPNTGRKFAWSTNTDPHVGQLPDECSRWHTGTSHVSGGSGRNGPATAAAASDPKHTQFCERRIPPFVGTPSRPLSGHAQSPAPSPPAERPSAPPASARPTDSSTRGRCGDVHADHAAVVLGPPDGGAQYGRINAGPAAG